MFCRFKKLFFFFLLFSFKPCFSFVGDLARSIKVLKINSLKQKILGKNEIKFTGNVEILIDQKMHIWADVVEVNKKTQVLIAKSKNGYIKIENSFDFLILAKQLFLNLENKTGYATNIKIHLDEGFISAQRAEKLDEYNWKLKDILFTPCDSVPPHWSITSKSAELHGNYLFKTKGIAFKTGNFPIFFWPYFAMPIQGHSKSGFLLPKLSFDDDLGFGIKEEFYWFIAPHCDSTIGVNWRDRKGVVLSNEFRWARNADSSTLINSYYVVDKDVFLQKKDKVVKGTGERYWIRGKNFSTLKKSFLKNPVYSLLRIDFGTDKRIGFNFLNETKDVGDTFYNSLIFRNTYHQDDFQIYFSSNKTERDKFSYVSDDQIKKIIGSDAFYNQSVSDKDPFASKKEVESRFESLYLPHFSWKTAYKKLFLNIFYRHDFFVDWVDVRKKQIEKYYFILQGETTVVETNELSPLSKGNTFRFFYDVQLHKSLKIKDQLIKFSVFPNFQLRSKVKSSEIYKKNCLAGKFFDDGIYRAFCKFSVDWFMPENVIHSNDYNYIYYFQPQFNWNFTPKMKQDNQYFADKWDRSYAENKLEFSLRNNFSIKDFNMDLALFQGVDFYSSDDIFYLKRSPGQNHFLPFRFDLNFNCNSINFSLSQEFNLRSLKLLQSQVGLSLEFKDFNCFLGLLYQDKSLQKRRMLISDIPHFLFLKVSVPISKHTQISYNGNFFSEKGSVILPIEGIKALLHKVYLNYTGHCYSFSLGFEEKNYRQFGNWKSERAFVLSIKLDSLGSFAKKFKRPVMSKK